MHVCTKLVLEQCLQQDHYESWHASFSYRFSSYSVLQLMQVSVALRESTAKSLIILDEFGKGTATVSFNIFMVVLYQHFTNVLVSTQVDGLSLLAASLRYWLSQGSQCPSVLVSTHFHSVIQQKLLPNSQLIEYLVGQTYITGIICSVCT